MSLECEGKGRTCGQCGVFDFLPLRCPLCSGWFCQQHFSLHRLPPIAGKAEGEWCAAAEAVSAIPESSSSPVLQDCFQCHLKSVSLLKCEDCGHWFCPPHRFHSHEAFHTQDEVKKSLRKSERYRGENITSVSSLRQACLGYTTSHPLYLAPPNHQGRLQDALMVVVVHSLPAANGPANTSAKVEALCSIQVAALMSLGQLVERFVAHAGSSISKVGRSAVYAMVPGSCEDGASSRMSSEPPVRLEQQQLSTMAKDALPLAMALVIAVGEATSDGLAEPDRSATEAAIRIFFGGLQDPSSEWKGESRALHLMTRLRLFASTQPKAHTTTSDVAEAIYSGGEAAEVPPAPAQGTLTDVCALPADSPPAKVEDEWPFRTPPPLTSLSLINAKTSPAGVAALPSGTHARVVVTILVEDRLLEKEVQPFCLAVAGEWSMGKVLDRVREEVRGRCGASRGAISEMELFNLSMKMPRAQWLSSRASLSQPSGLRNGDTLLFGLPSCRGCDSANAQVEAEVQRLASLEGKAKQELRLHSMRCCIM